jgi:phosphate:Na+ symporter
MTGGLRPLRNIPEVMAAISTLKADNFLGLVYCVLIAAFITAMIHSSSATIGIVMGLGSAGVLDWQTAVAFSLGADLGTTITSWMASLNLSKNAKRAAYAHISFNVIGVAVMLPLFFPSMQLLLWVMGWFGGDPGVAVVKDGKEIFPLVPVAVGLYSTAFNLFNTMLLFPFVGVFERVLSKVGRNSAEDVEDYSVTRFLDPSKRDDMTVGVSLVQKELARYVAASRLFLAIARGDKAAPAAAKEHHAAVDVLSRDIRGYTAAMFKSNMSYAQTDLLASLVEEEDFAASLGDTLYQVARRVEREPFTAAGRELVNAIVDKIDAHMRILSESSPAAQVAGARTAADAFLVETRDRALKGGPGELPWAERGAILALLGSAERAFFLIDRIVEERLSVPREVRDTIDQARELPAGGLAPA